MKIPSLFTTHKQKIIVASSILLCFVSGYSVSELLHSNAQAQNNNTPIVPYNQSSFVHTDKSCPVKGKKNSKGVLTYHLPGQAFYESIKNVQCFGSEAEARAAGYVKAGR